MASAAPTPRSVETRERILAAAERLFARHGFVGTSLRAVTKEAGVNLAAVNYHLGSKEALLHEVLARHVNPVNRERLRRLEKLEAKGENQVAAVLAAYIEPALEMGRRDPELRYLMSVLFGEPTELMMQLVSKLFGEVSRHFNAALLLAAPDLPREIVFERFQFCVGLMLHALSGRLDVTIMGQPSLPDEDGRGRRLIDFMQAGFAAPADGARGPQR